MDLIASPPLDNPIRPLDERAIDQEVATKDQVTKIPHLNSSLEIGCSYMKIVCSQLKFKI